MASRSRVSLAGPRMEPKRVLSDEQWQLIANLFPQESPGPHGGRPKAEPRRCVEGILWVLRSGARWKDLPKGFPSYPTCWRRLREWTLAGVWQRAWSQLLHKLDRAGRIDWDQSLADGMLVPAKKGVSASM